MRRTQCLKVVEIFVVTRKFKNKGIQRTIEHSENKIIMQSGLFENEIRPGVL